MNAPAVVLEPAMPEVTSPGPPPQYRENSQSPSSEDRLPEIPGLDDDLKDKLYWSNEKQAFYTGWGRPAKSQKSGPRQTRTLQHSVPVNMLSAVLTTDQSQTVFDDAARKPGSKGKGKRVD